MNKNKFVEGRYININNKNIYLSKKNLYRNKTLREFIKEFL